MLKALLPPLLLPCLDVATVWLALTWTIIALLYRCTGETPTHYRSWHRPSGPALTPHWGAWGAVISLHGEESGAQLRSFQSHPATPWQNLNLDPTLWSTLGHSHGDEHAQERGIFKERKTSAGVSLLRAEHQQDWKGWWAAPASICLPICPLEALVAIGLLLGHPAWEHFYRGTSHFINLTRRQKPPPTLEVHNTRQSLLQSKDR